MTRRVSIELVRREFRLSVTRPVAATAEARAAARDETDARATAPGPAECSVCGSTWFVVPAGGEEPALIQRAFEKHGIHTLLSPAGELLVCGRSFELHTAAFAVSRTRAKLTGVPGPIVKAQVT
jgi:hypothetical protein